jgi:hypothetical protein
MFAPIQVTGTVVQADRVLPLTRIIATIIIPFLLVAFVILYFFPEQSGEHFAWPIRPNMMAMYVGAGYLGGAYFFVRVLFARRWHHVAVGFLPVTAFTWSMLLLTVLHWERFDFTRFPAQIWLILYVITPLLVPWLWWRNRKVDPGLPDADDVRVPAAIRELTGAIGLIFLFGALLFYLVPGFAILIWPWQLFPPSARALGGWFALLGVGAVTVALERRWSGWRIEIESILVWQLLILIAALFNLSDFTHPLNWYLVVTTGGILGFLLFYGSMERGRRVRG